MREPRIKFVCGWVDVVNKVRDLVIEVALIASQKEGEEKLDEVVDRAAKWLDDQIEFRKTLGGRIAERLDGPIIRGLLSLLAQAEFNSLRIQGKV
jgi:hypothetical protein